MIRRHFLFLLLVIVFTQLPKIGLSNSEQSEEHIFVSMRMIGHEILLASGDSTTRVLPITKEEDRYKIQFASPLSFQSELLSYIVDSIVKETRIASNYIVEVKDCDSGNVVYSYEVNGESQGNIIPCAGRPQPKGCYVILMRIISPADPIDNWSANNALDNGDLKSEINQPTNKSEILFYIFIGLVVILLIALRIKKRHLKNESHLISIGSYLFDHKNMTLAKGNETQELTGKETDLLQLLFTHLNATVDRDIILKEVWRDEGAYIGRTLDVYISKLRKKFEADPAISIINVRGVGYKMTLN